MTGLQTLHQEARQTGPLSPLPVATLDGVQNLQQGRVGGIDLLDCLLRGSCVVCLKTEKILSSLACTLSAQLAIRFQSYRLRKIFGELEVRLNKSTSLYLAMSSHGNHCSFVLLAEFHIFEGAQLKYQFPQPLGVDEGCECR